LNLCFFENGNYKRRKDEIQILQLESRLFFGERKEEICLVEREENYFHLRRLVEAKLQRQ
jgi:hypothetical protein